MMRIEKAAVLGAGTMGAQIAAHLANAHIPTLLLDIPPRELTPEERAKGLTLQSKEVRNRIARNGLDAARKDNPDRVDPPGSFLLRVWFSRSTVGQGSRTRQRQTKLYCQSNRNLRGALYNQDNAGGRLLDRRGRQNDRPHSWSSKKRNFPHV